MSKFRGSVEDIVFRNEANGWTVINFKVEGSGQISAVGILPFISAGEQVILDGEITEHRDYGEQIKVSSYEILRPETKSGVEKYLGSGLIKGIGPATAKLIVKHFGVNTLDILEETPQRLQEIPGIGPKKAAMIAESFAMQNGMRTTLIFLQGAGLTPQMSLKVYRAFGDQSEAVLKKNPYRLADEIEGVGFETADKIARSMGFAADNPYRLISGVQYVLSSAVNRMGHMYLPLETLHQQAGEVLNVESDLVELTVNTMLINDFLISDEIAGEKAVYLPRYYQLECETANSLLEIKNARGKKTYGAKEAEKRIADFELSEGVCLSEKQREAVIQAVTGKVTVITGGPGTGKTTSINCIISLLDGMGETQLCAPTGRAAKRMSEATGCEAKTIHRMLEYSGDIDHFQKDEDDPLRADTVIVDEMSMVDIFLMRSLLRALKPGARLILVGDADQLPSVGAGNVLKDLIASGCLPVVALNEIFRQDSGSNIVSNAHRINRGEYPLIQTKNTDFFLERRESAAAALESVVALVKTRLPKYLGVDALRGIQVMAPMKKGALGVLQLNQALQAALNPADKHKNELQRGECIFRLGDKVMQIRNNYDIEWTRGAEDGEGVFNGDIGYVVSLDRLNREMTVEFDDGRRAVYDETMLDELEHSYCISVHKSQGSEFDAVVLPLLNGSQMLLTRNLLYTAVTRAKKLVVIVGREGCVQFMVDNNRIMHRYSALAVRLKALSGK
ncbi:MAG: ATP-dependent RecD-like DNA helicase [Clostridia bacterium]|nr:ATP-dependent RecD-like DNA helicase [Clostridia bacterium]